MIFWNVYLNLWLWFWKVSMADRSETWSNKDVVLSLSIEIHKNCYFSLMIFNIYLFQWIFENSTIHLDRPTISFWTFNFSNYKTLSLLQFHLTEDHFKRLIIIWDSKKQRSRRETLSFAFDGRAKRSICHWVFAYVAFYFIYAQFFPLVSYHGALPSFPFSADDV